MKLLIIILIFIFISCRNEKNTILTADLSFGDFENVISVTGEIKAKKSTEIKVPATLRGNTKILKMISEGTYVKEGDFLLQLDDEALVEEVKKVKNELKGIRAELEKSKASRNFKLKQMELDLENAKTSYELSKMRLSQIEFESKARQEQGNLEFKIAENNYIELREKLKLQSIINESERQGLLTKYNRMQFNLNKLNESIKDLTITAPDEGLVVYAKVWKGGKLSKIQIGDTPWRGQTLIELPDLSKIEAETTVNEVDISRIEKGMPCKIFLDAFENREYTGTIISISSLAHGKEDGSDQKVFDVIINIDGIDNKLKPGMSARCDIIINNLDSVLTVPLEAIFFDENGKYIWLDENNEFEKVKVEILDRNTTHAVINLFEKNLKDNRKVSLTDLE